jgi:hypothetical protein
MLQWIQSLVKELTLPQGYPLLATEKTKLIVYPLKVLGVIL